MELTNSTFAPLRVFVDELVRLGLRHAVIAPGSRNAPLAYALADRGEIKSWSVLDERSAAFFALGIAKSTREPVVVTCTSGTAAANLLPAVVEASHAGVPLIVLTADRPPELRDVGAGQSIDQIQLFGSAVRWFVEAGSHDLSEQTLRHFRALACRAWAETLGGNPGPVHLNMPLRDPLYPEPHDLGELELSEAATGRAGGAAWTTSTPPVLSADESLAGRLAMARRPLLVVGEQHQTRLAAAIADLAENAHIPVLADALSQIRRTEFAETAVIVSAYDLILRDATAREHMTPDLVVRIGELPTSKPLRSWLTELDCDQLVLDPRATWREPTRVAASVINADPLATVVRAIDELTDPAADRSWTTAWRIVELATQSAIGAAVDDEAFPFEPALYRNLLGGLRGGATVYVSSSMPVRDVEAFVAPGRSDIRFLSNRGANGIDGVVSSALGAAVTYGCDRVILLTGDLTVLHDVGALALIGRHEIDITIVCVDNDGGGIFSFLPVAGYEAHFEDKIATPSGVDMARVVQAFGLAYTAPSSLDEARDAVERPGFVHFKTGRADNKAGHDRVAAHIQRSVAAALAESGAAL